MPFSMVLGFVSIGDRIANRPNIRHGVSVPSGKITQKNEWLAITTHRFLNSVKS